MDFICGAEITGMVLFATALFATALLEKLTSTQ